MTNTEIDNMYCEWLEVPAIIRKKAIRHADYSFEKFCRARKRGTEVKHISNGLQIILENMGVI